MHASEAYEVVSKSTEDVKKLLEEGDVLDDDQLTIMKDLHTQLRLTESVLEVQRFKRMGRGCSKGIQGRYCHRWPLS